MGFIKANQTSTYYPNDISPFSHRFLLILSLLLISFPIFHLNSIFSHPQLIDIIRLHATRSPTKAESPRWLKAIREAQLTHQNRPLKVGLVNFKGVDHQPHLLPASEIAEYINIEFEPVSHNVTWKKLFPEWINEKLSDKCPTIPLPQRGKYIGLDVVVAKLPCRVNAHDNKSCEKEGIRDVHRLQVSLASARVVVENGIYVVFIAKCEPMVEIFKCDDLVWHRGLYWVYKPNVEKLKEILSMPLGACKLATPYYYTPLQGTRHSKENIVPLQEFKLREAYVTVLHSSEIYVCGAIALARSLLQTKTTRDLVLLADHTISNHSIQGLQAAGWIIKRINRIASPNANSNAYNKWNYSKLRVWQLTNYDKVMFIDSDFIVLQNIDHFFKYPQLSAGPNDKWLFNSGIMLLEPSECFFKYLMRKRYALKSYNGGDQGFLNEVLTWWHRFTRKLNFMKFYRYEGGNRSVPIDRYTIHYLGIKPWLCYRDYDCNWDRYDHHKFASDDVHAMWWKVYDTLPKELQNYCGLSKQLNNVLQIRRIKAQKLNLHDGHWKIEIKDPRSIL